MGKEIVPIFIDAAYSPTIFYSYVMGFFYNFYISLFICSEDIGDLTKFVQCINIYLLFDYIIYSISFKDGLYQCITNRRRDV